MNFILKILTFLKNLISPVYLLSVYLDQHFFLLFAVLFIKMLNP